MKFAHCSIAGPKGENQDAILQPFQVGDSSWCGIADGVGSSALGGLAARSSLEVVRQLPDGVSMAVLFEMVHRRLSEISAEHEGAKSISTTLSVLRISGDHAAVGHVGDTRITHYRGGGVMVRTKDQTEVQKLLDDGVLTKRLIPLTQVRLYVVWASCCPARVFPRIVAFDEVPIARGLFVGGEPQQGFE
jgi:serine/threonine protein phosphatase PrpC